MDIWNGTIVKGIRERLHNGNKTSIWYSFKVRTKQKSLYNLYFLSYNYEKAFKSEYYPLG